MNPIPTFTKCSFGKRTKLTRALINDMKTFAKSYGAELIVVDWRQDKILKDAKSYFEGMDIKVINTYENPPPGWQEWRIPGDKHPTYKAHRYVAELLVEKLTTHLGQER